MTFSGDLSGIGLADVFQNLAGNRATGTLHVRWDKGERFLRFAEGSVAGWSPGPGRELPLFDHVAERGHADPAGVQKLQANMKRRRKRPARLLLDEKLCDQESLTQAFREIVSEGVYELLTLNTATFVFNPGDAPPDEHGMIEIGYSVLPRFRGQGYATEIAHIMWSYAAHHPDVRVLRANVRPDNEPSRRIIEGAGFVKVDEEIDPEDGLEYVYELTTAGYRARFPI